MAGRLAGRSRFKLLNPDGLYDPTDNGYSHVALVDAPTRHVFVAGQGGERRDGSLPADFAQQTAQALGNVETALTSVGATLDDVFKLTVLVVDHTEERLRVLTDQIGLRIPAPMKPTCTLIPVPRLALDGMLVEIEVVAALP